MRADTQLPSTCSEVLIVAISRISLLRLGLPIPATAGGLGLPAPAPDGPTVEATAAMVPEVRLPLVERAADEVRVPTAGKEDKEDWDVCDREGRHFSDPARSTRLNIDRFRTFQSLSTGEAI